MSDSWQLLSLRTGQAVPGPRNHPTAIAKQPVSQAQYLEQTGFCNDQQGDTQHHGGLEKSVHHYAAEHYAQWAQELAELAVQNLQPGGLGY